MGRALAGALQQGEDGKCASTAAVLNVTTLRVPGFGHVPYLAGSEHAKMAVCVGLRQSDAPPRPLVVVGDLNNTMPQQRALVIAQLLHSYCTECSTQSSPSLSQRR